MKGKSPLITLAVGAVVAAMFLVLNTNAALTATDVPAEPAEAAPTQPDVSGQASSPAVAPAANIPTKPTTYVGVTQSGPGASIAVLINGDQARAYLCSGYFETWFVGTVSQGQLHLTSKKGGSLTGTVTPRSARGEVTIGRQHWQFKIPEVPPPSGLYRVAETIDGAKVVGGWIVLPSGKQIGAFSRDGETAGQAPKLDLNDGSAELYGEKVRATAVDGATPF